MMRTLGAAGFDELGIKPHFKLHGKGALIPLCFYQDYPRFGMCAWRPKKTTKNCCQVMNSQQNLGFIL